MLKKTEFHWIFLIAIPAVFSFLAFCLAYFPKANLGYTDFTQTFSLHNQKISEVATSTGTLTKKLFVEYDPPFVSLITIPRPALQYVMCAIFESDNGDLGYPQITATLQNSHNSAEYTEVLKPNSAPPFCGVLEEFKSYNATGRIIRDDKKILSLLKNSKTGEYTTHAKLTIVKKTKYGPWTVLIVVVFSVYVIWWSFLYLFSQVNPSNADRFSSDRVSTWLWRKKSWIIGVWNYHEKCKE